MRFIEGLRGLRQHPLVLPFYLPSFIIAISWWGMQTPVLPLYVRDFGASYGLVGLVLSGQAIGMLLGDLPSGLALGRLGQKRAMVVGLLCAALSAFGLVWARSIPEVLVYRLFAGLGFSIFGVARHTYIAEQAAVENRGRAVALFGGVNRIGRFAGPVIGGFIAEITNLRVPFLLIGALTFVALFIVLRFVPRDAPAGQTRKLTLAAYLGQLRALARGQFRTLVTAGGGQIFAQMVRAGPRVLIPLYAADVLGLDVAQIGVIISIGSAIDMTLFYPVGVIMDRFGRKFAIVPSFLLQGIGLALIPLTGGFTGLASVAGLIGLGNGLGSGTMMTLGADLAPPGARGEFLGMWRLIGDTGWALGPLVAGSIAGALALPVAALAMAGSGLVATLIFILLVPETVKKLPAKDEYGLDVS